MKTPFMKCGTALTQHLTNYPSYGSENNNVADFLVSLLLVISPLLQHYKGIGLHAGNWVLILCLPYIYLKLLFRFRSLELKRLILVAPLLLYQVYAVVAHGTTFMEVAHKAVLFGYFAAIALGGINLKYVSTCAYFVAIAGSVAIIVQSLCFYLFGFHLQLVATNWLSEESSPWILLAQTGLVDIRGNLLSFYRPSAFFLEPSHMLLYFIPNLFLLLLTPDINRGKQISAILLSAGLILSTSGMGVAFVVGIWLLQLGFSSGKENLLRFKNLFRKKNILHCLIFGAVFIVIIAILPFLRYSILRIFLGSHVVNAMIAAEERGATAATLEAATAAMQEAAQAAAKNPGSTAISGRIKQAISLIRNQMHGMQYIFGVTDSVDHIKFNRPGFFSVVYKYGIIGTLLSYGFYVPCALFSKGAYRWAAIIIIALSFASGHTHGTFYMLFYILMLMDGAINHCSLKENTNSV